MAEKLERNLSNTNYGYIKLKLGQLLKKKGVSVYYLHKRSQIEYSVVRRWCTKETLTRFDSDILARFCYVLECDPGAILEFVPTNQETV